jgi:tetratricopeptide (TPR) repeat protein
MAPVNELGGTVSGSVVQAGVVHGGIHLHGQLPGVAQRLPTPRQLPGPPPLLVSRADELSALERMVGLGSETGAGADPEPLGGPVVLTGPPGVGKAAVALAWLHRRRRSPDPFPDGELYADLRSPGEPVQPQTVLRGFLTALGVPPENVPPDLAGSAALYRSATASRRMAVLLHGAVSAAQVRPLIPGGTSCLTVVTSTWRLATLRMDGARWLTIAPLEVAAAVRLLEELAGPERIAGEMDAAREVARLCGGLPLAVSMVGIRLALNPHQRLGRLASELEDERRRLDRLAEEGNGVRTIIDTCYRELPAEAARLYRVLGALPVARFSDSVAAAAASASAQDVGGLLRLLSEANLLEQTAEDAYHFHELVRLHAREVSRSAAHEAERDQAVIQVELWYLATAAAAAGAVRPYRRDVPAAVPGLSTPPLAFTGLHQALDWLDEEAAQLLSVARNAAEQQRPDTALRLAGQMWALFAHRKYYRIWQEFDLLGLRCARELGDRGAEARMLRRLGLLSMDLGGYDEASGHLTAAAALFEQLPDRHRTATAVNSLGVVFLRRGEPAKAIRELSRALAMHEELGDRRQCALVLIDLADALIESGRPQEALERLTAAEELLGDSPDLYTGGHLRMLAGRARGRIGRDPALAQADLDSAVETMRGLDSASGQIEALGYRGELAERSGAVDVAAAYYERAGELLLSLGAPGGAWLGQRIRTLSRLAGRILARGSTGPS